MQHVECPEEQFSSGQLSTTSSSGLKSFKWRENNNCYLVHCVPTRHRHQAPASPPHSCYSCARWPWNHSWARGLLARQTDLANLPGSKSRATEASAVTSGRGPGISTAWEEWPSSEQDAFLVISAALPWQAPVRMLGMKPRRQGWGWAGHISQGWPQARPTVAQQSVLVQTIPLSCPWHIWLLTTVKHGPVL